MSGWIGVDLDGTLAEYGEWEGVDHIGPPIPKMVERVKGWLADGRDVRIFTARVGGAETDAAIPVINAWIEGVFGRLLPITNVKDFAMIELWDDRAVQVEKNTGEPVGYSTRGL